MKCIISSSLCSSFYNMFVILSLSTHFHQISDHLMLHIHCSDQISYFIKLMIKFGFNSEWISSNCGNRSIKMYVSVCNMPWICIFLNAGFEFIAQFSFLKICPILWQNQSIYSCMWKGIFWYIFGKCSELIWKQFIHFV